MFQCQWSCDDYFSDKCDLPDQFDSDWMGQRAKCQGIVGYSFALYLDTPCLFVVGDASEHTSKIKLQHGEACALSVLVCYRYIRTGTCYMGGMATTHVGQCIEAGD
jgi:hypothetical protein